jgi:hypothetical protein
MMMPRDGEHRERPGQGLKVLLIAYEFPPSPSPQSLRWAYLVRELVSNGHQVHVLAPEHPGSGLGLPVIPASVVVHRTFAGPGMGLLNVLARRGRRRAPTVPRNDALQPEMRAAPDHEGAPAPLQQALNWKGQVHNGVNRLKVAAFHNFQRLISGWFFPDGRAEWYPWARRRLQHLLSVLQPDLVISSHEPATTLSLGLIAQRAGVPWIADLGDPVLAPYTPFRWRSRAMALEREVCAGAALITTTATDAVSILRERHAVPADRFQVFTQGFDGSAPEEQFHNGGDVLELLYTGSFYAFRRSSALLEAVKATPGVRLNIASINVPEEIVAASRQGDAIRLLGFLPHDQIVCLQRRHDVLVNIANDDPCQIPGKFYEYLGAGRPILHIGSGQDAAAELLGKTGRGWVCAGDVDALAALLNTLRASFRRGGLTQSMDLSRDPVRHYDWREIGARLDSAIRAVVGTRLANETRTKYTT